MGELLWLDLETTDTDPRAGEILEVGVAYGHVRMNWVVRPTKTLSVLDPVVREMHTRSGLLEECERAEITTADVERALLALVGDREREREYLLTLAGFSVHFDLAWLRVHMPHLARHLSHRVYDVSTVVRLTEEMTNWERPEGRVHRALPDVLSAMATDDACRAALSEYLRSS